MARDYKSELSKLAREVSSVEHIEAKRGQAAQQALFRRLSDLYLQYRYLVERGEVNQAPRGIRILYAKLISCVAAIDVLLRGGLAGPAAMVLRTLFETGVHLQVILKEDTNNRCKLFEDYLIIERSRATGRDEMPAEILARNAADLERVKRNYHPSKPRSWCWKAVPSPRIRKGVPENPNLRELCEYIGYEKYYKELYGRLSGAIHPLPSYESWMRREDGSIELGPNFAALIGVTGNLAITIGMDALLRALSFFKPADEKELYNFIIQSVAPTLG